jgi:hypothetical protein
LNAELETMLAGQTAPGRVGEPDEVGDVAALAASATEIHPPGPQNHHDPRCDAAQVRDPDGHSLEFIYKEWQH